MHRNAEIWAARHRRLEEACSRKKRQFAQARNSPSWSFLCGERSDAWLERYDALERRVWHALCIANGWRKA